MNLKNWKTGFVMAALTGLLTGIAAVEAFDVVDPVKLLYFCAACMAKDLLLFLKQNHPPSEPEPDRRDSAGRAILLFLLLIIPLFLTGCVMQRASEYNPETRTVTRYVGIAWFNNTAIKGLNVGKKTKTTSNLFSLEEGNNEVQTEAIRAMAEGLATGAVKGAVPVP